MAIKEIVAQIRAKLSDEEASKVSDLLSSITREATDIQEDLNSANHESKTRKEKIRELQKEIDNKTDSKEDFEAKLAKKDKEIEELTELKGKYEAFKAKELEDTTKKFNAVIKGLTVEETDPKFETYKKVLNKLTLAEKDEKLTMEQIKANLTIYEYAKEFGALKIDEEDFDEGENPSGKKKEKIDDPLDALSK